MFCLVLMYSKSKNFDNQTLELYKLRYFVIHWMYYLPFLHNLKVGLDAVATLVGTAKSLNVGSIPGRDIILF